MSTKTIIQIAIGSISQDRISDMKTVENYALKHNYGYEVISSLPIWAIRNDISARIASDWMRIELLSTRPYTLYVDYDVEITGDIELGEDPILTPYFEHFIYNGNNIQLFKKVYENMMNRRSRSGGGWKIEIGTIYKAFRTVDYDKCWMRDSDGLYIHKWASKGEKDE